MKKNYFLKVTMIMLLLMSTTGYLKAQNLSTGDIAIVAFNADGDDDIAFVALSDIPASESIYFTDNEWNGTAFSDLNEGEVTWTNAASILSAGSVVIISDISNSGTQSANIGTVTGSNLNLGASNEWIYALTSAPATSYAQAPTFLAAFANDAGSGWLTGTGLTEGSTAIDFNDDNDGYEYTGTRTGEASFSNYLAIINNTSNWQIETSNGENILPIDATSFSTGAPTPGITLGAVSGNTTEAGGQATFTVVLDAQPAIDVVLNVSSGDTGEITLDAATLTFTNANWDTPQTVTATGVDDGLQDGNIDVTITVSVDDALSDNAYDPIADETTTITNEDDELPSLVINEILADPADGPAPSGDANGDGTRDGSDDEFVELYNSTGAALDISGYTLNDGNGLRHTFPQGTVIPEGGTIVVFGGGTVTNFTNVGGLVQVASSGALGLNNGGDTITVFDAQSATVVTETYGSAGNNQSIARNPDFTGAFEDHSGITGNTVDFSPGKDNTDNSPFINTWTGATDNDWATATNWLESDTPGTTDHVVIRSGLTNYPTASGAVTVGSVIVESGATLIAQSSFAGSLSYKRALGTTNWYLMSSPVIGEEYDNAWATANAIASGQNNNVGVSTYDNTTNDGTTGHWRYLQTGDATTNFNTGQGYGILRASAGDVTFTGTGVHTSSQTFGITQGASNNFNLVGNPFTAFLNLGDFFADNGAGVISGATAWFWNGTSYDARNSGIHGSFEIAPGQGFFVEAAANTNLTFDFADLTHQGTDSFQRDSADRTEINLFLVKGSESRYANVYYIDGTTTGYDEGYDSKLFGGTAHNLAVYTHLISDDAGDKYQLQSLPNSEYENMIIPIGVIAEAGEVTFSADVANLPTGYKVFLEDKDTGNFIRLDEEGTEYKVTFDTAVNGIGRFFLHMNTNALSTGTVDLSNISAYLSDARNLRVVGIQNGSTQVRMFNILGKQVVNTSFEANGVNDVALPNLQQGVYIIQINAAEGTINKKVVVE